jgi:hypothetical protein
MQDGGHNMQRHMYAHAIQQAIDIDTALQDCTVVAANARVISSGMYVAGQTRHQLPKVTRTR